MLGDLIVVTLKLSIIAIVLFIIVYFSMGMVNKFLDWYTGNQVKIGEKTHLAMQTTADFVNQSKTKINATDTRLYLSFYLTPGSQMKTTYVKMNYVYYLEETKELFVILYVGDETFDYTFYYIGVSSTKTSIVVPTLIYNNMTIDVSMDIELKRGIKDVQFDIGNGIIIEEMHEYPILYVNMTIDTHKITQ